MKTRNLVALLALAACSATVATQEGATSAAGSGGVASTSAATSAASGGGPDAGPADAAPDVAEPCPPGQEPTRCAGGCAVQDGGACPCDPDQAPNCPAGWWKVCCAGDGAPCDPPVIDASVVPACGPGPAPAWCVSYPLACQQ